MRLYSLLNFQHVILFILPALLFIIIFGLGLGYFHFWSPNTQRQKKSVVNGYPDGIEEKNAPFPLALFLIVLGTVLWAFLYIFVIGWTGVKI